MCSRITIKSRGKLISEQFGTRKKNKPKIRKKKTLKQRLSRIKENIIRAINKEKWKEQQRIREILGKEIVRFM
ncbi:UDP-Gal--lipooligosaccharide galactosyltransferase [Aggregatibacter actinomycetemcomitans NUM4039]|nr:UDP-Gal--lipooligosaccharide galactosyltransferase [Aggregatibacter actinomycetemcomitans NUM4039]